ncbi:MAG TPA: hypothetical protein VF999_11255, partial [Thermoanaerobaculia bacterium]
MKRTFRGLLLFLLALPTLAQQPPQPTTPQPATSQPATPQPATPQPMTPQPATPQPMTPQPQQQQKQQDVPTYTETAGSEYVLLPVLVLDKKGRFVDGLEKKDFRVRVDTTP